MNYKKIYIALKKKSTCMYWFGRDNTLIKNLNSFEKKCMDTIVYILFLQKYNPLCFIVKKYMHWLGRSSINLKTVLKNIYTKIE